MTATITPDDRAAEWWNQCIACGGVRSSRFFCRACVDAGVDEELNRDNPILHRHDGDAASIDSRSIDRLADGAANGAPRAGPAAVSDHV
jgi:hypothetical protein